MAIHEIDAARMCNTPVGDTIVWCSLAVHLWQCSAPQPRGPSASSRCHRTGMRAVSFLFATIRRASHDALGGKRRLAGTLAQHQRAAVDGREW